MLFARITTHMYLQVVKVGDVASASSSVIRPTIDLATSALEDGSVFLP